jgi:hypothetical protein
MIKKNIKKRAGKTTRKSVLNCNVVLASRESRDAKSPYE